MAGLVLFWLLLAIGVGYLADSRGRSAIGFFLLSLLLSPLVGFAVVLVMKDLVEEQFKEQQRREEHQRQLESIRAIATTAATAPAAAAQPAQQLTAGIVADELAKLAGLRDQGVLTEDEFQGQKKVLLGR